MADGRMKDFIVIGPSTAMHYNCTEPLIRKREINVYTPIMSFRNGDTIGRGLWFTTFARERNEFIPTEEYSPEKYPKYDNYDAIEVRPYTRIPADYNGLMGVGISFYYSYPEEYEVVGKRSDLKINGKTKFERLIIRRKQL